MMSIFCNFFVVLLVIMNVKISSIRGMDDLFLSSPDEIAKELNEYVTTSGRGLSVGRKAYNTSYSWIPNTSIGDKCRVSAYEKHAAVYLSQGYSGREFMADFNRMIDKINNKEVNATDVCFNKDYFLECDLHTQTCKCASEGEWGNLKYEEVEGACHVGKGGRCSPHKNISLHHPCVKGTACVQTDKKYESKKNIHLCLPPKKSDAANKGLKKANLIIMLSLLAFVINELSFQNKM